MTSDAKKKTFVTFFFSLVFVFRSCENLLQNRQQGVVSLFLVFTGDSGDSEDHFVTMFQ